MLGEQRRDEAFLNTGRAPSTREHRDRPYVMRGSRASVSGRKCGWYGFKWRTRGWIKSPRRSLSSSVWNST